MENKIRNDKCGLWVEEILSPNYDFTLNKKVYDKFIQITYETRIISKTYSSGDYDDYDYLFKIKFEDMISELDLWDAIETLKIKVDTVEVINNFFNFLYDNTTMWEALDEKMQELAQEYIESRDE